MLNAGARHGAGQRGFTLIEILVVIIIIGVVLTFATLSVNPSSPSDRLNTESQRLLALSQAAADDAILYGQTIGLQLTSDGYQFIVLGPGGWKPITDPDSPMRPRQLDEDIHIDRLAADNRDQDNRNGAPRGGLSLPSSPMTPRDNADSSNRRADDNRGETVPRPDALFLSSGELLPFRLEVSADGVDQRFDIIGQANGDLRIERAGQ